MQVEKKRKKETKLVQKQKSIWLKMIDETHYTMLREMKNSNVSIIKWQKLRVIKSISTSILMFFLYFLSPEWYYLALGFGLGFGIYYLQAKDIKAMYQQYKFERQLQFAKFTRLLVPYLKKYNDSGNMFGIFNKIVSRLDHETDRSLLMKLMKDMGDFPNDVTPFIEYAEKSSGSDMSSLFMQTVFDIKQGASDLDVIVQLDQIASEDMMEMVDSIIEYKSKKFNSFPTQITMTILIIIIGFGASILIHEISSNIGFMRT